MEQSQISKLLFCKHNSMCHPISFIMLRSNQNLNKKKLKSFFFSNLWMAIKWKMRPRNLMRKHFIKLSYKMKFILNELSVSLKKKETSKKSETRIRGADGWKEESECVSPIQNMRDQRSFGSLLRSTGVHITRCSISEYSISTELSEEYWRFYCASKCNRCSKTSTGL